MKTLTWVMAASLSGGAAAQTVVLFDQFVDSRWASRDSTGIIGGDEDQVFDAVFHKIMLLSRQISDLTDSYVQTNQRAIAMINIGMVVILVLIFSALMALLVWLRARSSRTCPKSTKAVITAAASK